MEKKFRLWDEIQKKMHYSGFTITSDGKLAGTYGLFPSSKTTLLQYIGEKDRNKKEIWEADIIKFKGQEWDSQGRNYEPIRIEVVKFENGCFFAPHMYEEDCHEIGWDEVEVIGNFKENPELLKEDI